MRRLLALSLCCACGQAPADDTGTTDTTGVVITGTGMPTSTDAVTTGEPTDTAPTTAWQIGLQVPSDRGALLSVWGPAPDEVYAVGGQQQSATASTGILYKFDGATWQEQPLPPGTPMLHWIFGVDRDLWTVGRDGTTMRREGDVWVTHATGTDTILWGVWGPLADLLWTVGGDGVDDDPIMLRWDGAVWTSVPLPPTDKSTGLFKIWGTAADDVTAVGDRGLALHFDGADWTHHPSSDLADLISVWGRAPDEHLAVGGRANGRVARWDGITWTGETFPVPGLSGIWMDPTGAATIVGMQGTIFELAPGSMELVKQDSPTQLLLHAVFGFTDGPRFAVGGSLTGPPPYVGTIVQHVP